MSITSHSAPPRFGVGLRLALVLSLGLLPILIFFVYWIETERRDAHDTAATWLRDRAQQIAVEHQHFLRQVKHTLEMIAVSGNRTIGQPDECQRLLRDVRERREWMKDAWIIDANARTLCATDPAASPPQLDAEHHDQLEESGFAMTEVRQDSDDGSHHVVAAMLTGVQASVHRVMIETTVDIDSLSGLAGDADAPNDALVMTLDQKGRVMTHSDESVGLLGKAVHSHPTIARLMELAGTVHVGTLHDDVTRLLTSVRVPEWGSTIIVGLGRDSVLATSRRDLMTGITVLLAVLLATGGIVWLSGMELILKPVRDVRDTALSMAEGNFGRRVRTDRGPSEIQQMGRAFNSMADRLEGLALNDELTGLANRRVLDTHLAKLAERAEAFAVLTVDLDNFKPINDRFGHAAGDETLKVVANRLADCVNGHGLGVRVGGDEFIVILDGSDAASLALRAVTLGERIRSAVAAPILLAHGEVAVASSIGIAVRSDGSADIAALLNNADRALYAAKAAGRNQVIVFDGSQPEIDPEKVATDVAA